MPDKGNAAQSLKFAKADLVASPGSMKGGDAQFVTALARGLEVLRCFTPATPELSVTQIARATKLPQPTVWRLCHTLIELGFLTSSPGRATLRPGLPVLSLGYAVLAAQSLAELARPDMQAIASKYEGAVSLGARDGSSMVYIQRVQGSQIIFANLQIGSRVPIATSATGWAYVAGLGEQAREELFEDLAEAAESDWHRTEPRLRAALNVFTKTGYMLNKGSMHALANSVAVPVTSGNGRALLALSSGGIAEVFDDKRLALVAEDLKRLGAKLSTLLTHHPPP